MLMETRWHFEGFCGRKKRMKEVVELDEAVSRRPAPGDSAENAFKEVM